MDKYIGKMLDGRYEILEVIGVGGMAVVYKAMCHRLNRLVAIKILKDEYSNDEEFRRRFHAESQAVAMMSHPNIVNVYDVSKSDEINYIVMELIDGITLKQYMEKRGKVNWRETLHFSMQIAKALDHAHSRGIVHRDIKPHNIMILKDGSVKVADFGIARVASAQNTLTKEALGSVHYISPEQAKGGRVDNRTDLYSLGVVMYQMLTGRPPYDGDTPVAVAIQHINGTPLQPSLLTENIPVGLEQITMHAMCADIDRRYASAGDMLRDMEEFRKNPSIHFDFGAPAAAAGIVQPTPVNRPVPQAPAAPVRKKKDYDLDEREERGKRIIIIAVVICALLAVFGIGYLIVRAMDNPATETTDTTDPTVPNMVGKVWENVNEADYPDFVFLVDEDSYEENDDYDKGVICRQSVAPNTVVKKGREIRLYISLGTQTDIMPDFVKKSEKYAVDYLKAIDIKVKCLTETESHEEIEEGYVIRTDPAAGETLKDGQIVTIYVSSGPENKTVLAPSLIGSSLSSAKTVLDAKKLKWKESYEASTTVKEGYIINQFPSANTELKEGDTVELIISSGAPEVVMVPSQIGNDVSVAADTLTALGLQVDTSDQQYNAAPMGTVIDQNPTANSSVAPGTTVYLTVSLGPQPDPNPEQGDTP